MRINIITAHPTKKSQEFKINNIMGRYLVIGIATQLAFKKKEAETVLESVEKAKKHVT